MLKTIATAFKARTYYDCADGPVWIEHEQLGTARVRSWLEVGAYHADFDWPPGVARWLLESNEPRLLREFTADATRRLIAAAIAAGRLPAERCDHVGEGGLCRRRWTIEVAYDRVRIHRCAEHGHRFRIGPPGPSLLYASGPRMQTVPPQAFERVTVRE